MKHRIDGLSHNNNSRKKEKRNSSLLKFHRMEDDFVFPDRPADLCDPRCELPLRCADLVDVSVLEKEELDEFVDRKWSFPLFFQFRRHFRRRRESQFRLLDNG